MKCKNCIYYSGIQCHGHGEYYGICQLYDKLIQYASVLENRSRYDYKIKHYTSCWSDICYDDSDCHIIEVKK